MGSRLDGYIVGMHHTDDEYCRQCGIGREPVWTGGGENVVVVRYIGFT